MTGKSKASQIAAASVEQLIDYHNHWTQKMGPQAMISAEWYQGR